MFLGGMNRRREGRKRAGQYFFELVLLGDFVFACFGGLAV